MYVEPLEVPTRIANLGQERLYGGYSKLQAWQLFDDDPHWRARRVIMLDVDMFVRSQNIDDLFGRRAPAAVFTNLWQDSTIDLKEESSYYREGDVDRYLKGGWNNRMLAGINAGLMYFKPDAWEFDQMKALERKNTITVALVAGVAPRMGRTAY